MNWNPITDENDISQIIKKSFQNPQVIFKHSTRCSISSMAKSRLERSFPPDNTDFNFLDLIKLRNISNFIAEEFNVQHESPQVLLIVNGKCKYHESHNGIDMEEIEKNIS